MCVCVISSLSRIQTSFVSAFPVVPPRSDVPVDEKERERESHRAIEIDPGVVWLVLGVECARTARMKNKREEEFESR
jgi:hypothetical protein